MKKKVLLVFLLLLLFNAKAQNALDIIDGLKKELKTYPDAKRTAAIYSDLTWYYSNVSTDSALCYGQKAIAESNKLKDSTLLAQVNSDLGAVYYRRNDIANSKKYYYNALKIRKLRNDNLGIAKVNINLANILNKENKKKLALQYYLEGIDYFEKMNNPQIVSVTKANVGILFVDLKNYAKAKKYLGEAIAYQEKVSQHDGLCTSYLSMGNVYLRLKDTINAVKFYEKSIASSKKAGNKISLSSALSNLGSIKSQQQKSSEANALFKKSRAIQDSINLKNNESGLSLNVAKEHIMYQRFDKANAVLYRLKKEYENDPNAQENLLLTYQYFIHTYGYLKESDSVNYYNNLATKFQNTIIETAVTKQTNELETRYQTEKKERLLQKSKAEVATRELEIRKKETQFLILGLITLTLLVIVYLVYRQQKLKNKQQAQEFQLKTAIAKIETQNKLQEQRLDISRDLHDNIGSQLTFIISSVDNVKYAFDIQNDKLENKLSGISNFAKSTIIELRDTIWAMNKNEITFEDLQSRIHNFIDKAQEAKEDIQFNFTVDSELKKTKFTSVEGMNLYRTIQEAINNSIKYAHAKTVNVTIQPKGDTIVITVADDGKGFNINEIEFGNGINNMRKRITDIKGVFNIQSNPESGTQIQIEIKNV